MTTSIPQPPLTDAVIFAICRLIDDARVEPKREPSHSQLEWMINRAGLVHVDPHRDPTVRVGKAKRLREVLTWALEHDPERGERLSASLVTAVQGAGGFRPDGANYVGADAVAGAVEAFRTEGWDLGSDGDLRPQILEAFAGTQMTDALHAYVRRAQRGVRDAALLTGTGKDLLEATAKHVLQERFGGHPDNANFPTLLGQAFTALGLATSAEQPQTGEPPQQSVDRALYDLGCAINRLRNREGTGHGRPFLPSVTDEEARAAVQAMGLVSDRLLRALDR